MKCKVEGCKRKGQYLQAIYRGKAKIFGLVCPTHDRFYGRRNLVNTGMTIEEAIQFERDTKKDDDQ